MVTDRATTSHVPAIRALSNQTSVRGQAIGRIAHQWRFCCVFGENGFIRFSAGGYGTD